MLKVYVYAPIPGQFHLIRLIHNVVDVEDFHDRFLVRTCYKQDEPIEVDASCYLVVIND